MADKSTFDCVGSNDVCNSLNHIHIWAERPYRFASFFGKQNKVIIFCHSTVKVREKDGKNHKKFMPMFSSPTHILPAPQSFHMKQTENMMFVCALVQKKTNKNLISFVSFNECKCVHMFVRLCLLPLK